MPRKPNSITSRILSILSEIGEMMPMPFETPYTYIKRAGHFSHPQYHRAVRDLKKRKAVEISRRQGKGFLNLTKKGELEALLSRARLITAKPWDGKWRVVIFDIPEQARDKRDRLRLLLKHNGFKKLQASVFVSPFALNRAAIEYLRKSGLINFIRVLRVDECDDDRDLQKMFRLKSK
ncbi:MAG: CRISPR-associated endonuclease Cas2 [Patescibacteria group bacterium]|nr:CRISPR-associated endonuclease Cas2 [Patescibacteria group bacterium]